MSNKKRRYHTAEDKVTLIRLHLVEKKPVSEICDENNLHPNIFYRWQKEFFENGAAAFNTRKPAKKDTRDDRIDELQRKLTDRDEGIAELMMEHVKLKKKLGLS